MLKNILMPPDFQEAFFITNIKTRFYQEEPAARVVLVAQAVLPLLEFPVLLVELVEVEVVEVALEPLEEVAEEVAEEEAVVVVQCH